MKQANSFLIPLGAAAMGVVGGILRSRQLASAYDSGNLPVAWASSTMLLVAVSAVCALILVMLALSLGKGRAVLSARPVPSAIAAAGGLLLGISGAVAIPGASAVDPSTFYSIVLYVTVIAGICLFVYNFMTVAGKTGSGAVMLVPVFCLCIRLVYVYKNMSADPIIINYIFQLLAFIMLVAGVFLVSGVVFDEPKPRLTLAVSLCGIYFSVLVLWEAQSFAGMLFSISGAVYLLALSVMVIQGSEKKE